MRINNSLRIASESQMFGIMKSVFEYMEINYGISINLVYCDVCLLTGMAR